MKESTTTRKVIISIVCALSFFTTPSIMAYKAWCGKEITTVEEDAFDDPIESKEYFEFIDEYLCGPKNP